MKQLLILGLMLAAGAVQALTIDARLVSFDSTDAVVNGGNPSGGIGTFELLTDVTGTEVDFLGAQFMAQCIEPTELVSLTRTYRFDVVLPRFAPTSRPGGMGLLGEQWLERMMAGLGYESVEDVAAASDVMQSAVQMATYEAAGETSGLFDWQAGSTLVSGSGASASAAVTTAVGGSQAVEGYALLNIADLDRATRSTYRGQDFIVYTTTPMPEPGVLMLMGLGLLGLRKWSTG